MKTAIHKTLYGAMAVSFALTLSGCFTDGGGDVTITVSDTTEVRLNFTGASPYIGRDSINMTDVRQKLRDKGAASITGIGLTDLKLIFGDSAKMLIQANTGVHFVLSVYYQVSLLALQTSPTAPYMTFDTNVVSYALNGGISGVSPGFVPLKAAIADTTVSKIKLKVMLELKDALRTTPPALNIKTDRLKIVSAFDVS